MRTLITSVIVAVAVCTSAHAAEPASIKTEFLRFVKNPDGSAKLEAAVARYANARTGQTVDLVSAVHVGDAAYYHALNDRFKKYDAVLYEMVKPADAPAPEPGQPSGSAISGMQRFVTRALDLAYQLDEVDYAAANFVHADMDVETFTRRMDARGESLFSLMMRAMMNDMTNPRPGRPHPDVQLGQLLFALQAPDRATQLKQFIGAQFQDIDQQVAMLEGPDGSVILTERNAAAMKVLRDELASGKKTLAVFYGAAHLRGMDAELTGQMGFAPTGQDWLTAWDIAIPTKVPVAPVTTRPATLPAPQMTH